MRLIRSSSSVTSRTVSSRSAGSSPMSSRWPRTMVMGVRSSCPASSTNSRWAAKARSSRSSMPLNVSARAAMSSLPCTGIRRVRPCSVSCAAAVRTTRTGLRIRPATSQAMPTVSSRATPEMTSSVRNMSFTRACSRSGWKATTNAASGARPCRDTVTFAQRISPSGRWSTPEDSGESKTARLAPGSRCRGRSTGRSCRWRICRGPLPARPTRPISSSSASGYCRSRNTVSSRFASVNGRPVCGSPPRSSKLANSPVSWVSRRLIRLSTSRSRNERVVMATEASATAITSSSQSRMRTRAETRRRPGSVVGAGSVVARSVVSVALPAVVVIIVTR